MTAQLSCYSFHSVKGGVGKSTLSTLTACALAKEHPSAQVVLVDMDLTGTSLADVLPLEAPSWENIGPDEAIDLLKRPAGFSSRKDSRARIKKRGLLTIDSKKIVGVPFLNDYLLFEPKVWDEDHDISPLAISWRLAFGPNNLVVYPSSALPRDLARALPVIYDEEHAAFLEGRLEHLLSAILAKREEVFVVFDTPPTIPGLSHSILNMAFRLAGPKKIPLAKEDEFIPEHLQNANIDWNVRIVATQDMQDIRAAARWLELVPDEHQSLVRLLLNRASSERGQREDHYWHALRDPSITEGEVDIDTLESPNPILSNPIWVEEQKSLREIFQSETAPAWVSGFLDQVTGKPDVTMELE